MNNGLTRKPKSNVRERVAELERELSPRRQWARFRFLRFFVQTYTTQPVQQRVELMS